ncbi:MAG: ABC transporter ATP-binding protein [Geobacteraceae bacterium]|nr:MAG: ABC transporter ATP-binding protein [Geobacteraceae bacterium]
MSLLQVSELGIDFGGLKAVNGVDMNIKEGEILSIIGPNGAGKTTLFNLISGFLKPNKGRMIFDGTELTGMPAHRIATHGLVRTFQKTNLFSEVTVREGVAMGFHKSRHAGLLSVLFNGREARAEIREVKCRTKEVLDFVGLASLADYRGKNLPYGKQRMLAVAVALAAEPKLLMLDEPATGMNPNESQELMNLIHRLRDEKKITICLIEHNMNVVIKISDRIVVMNCGKKVAEGLPQEITTNDIVIEAYLGRGFANAQN